MATGAGVAVHTRDSEGVAVQCPSSFSKVQMPKRLRVEAAGTAAASEAARAVLVRCSWASASADALMQAYHDEEWGRPLHDDQRLFEMLTLEGAQAGLSWSTILKRRAEYRRAFHNFDVDAVAKMTDEDEVRLFQGAEPGAPNIIKNRAKIRSTIQNAKAVIAVRGEFGSFDAYLWSFVNNKPLRIDWASLSRSVPAVSAESTRLSDDMKARGFAFCGPTIMYAFMQACGLVNDHAADCFCVCDNERDVE